MNSLPRTNNLSGLPDRHGTCQVCHGGGTIRPPGRLVLIGLRVLVQHYWMLSGPAVACLVALPADEFGGSLSSLGTAVLRSWGTLQGY